MRVGFIGFGNAAFDMARGLRARGLSEIFFHKHRDKPPFSGLLARRVEESGAIYQNDYAALAAASPVLFSCVVGRAALEVTREAAPHLSREHL